MKRHLSKLYNLRNFAALFSSLPFGYTRKMVRYFPNPYEDYTPGNEVIDKNSITHQINEHVTNITKRLQPSRKKVEGGLYVGITGVSYAFFHLSKNAMVSEHKAQYLKSAAEYLQPALEVSAGDRTSFILGDAGTFALATVLYKELANEHYKDTLTQYKSLYPHYLHPKFLKCGGDELFVGRAGYLAGALWMSQELKTQIFTNNELFKLCDVMVASGKEYSKKHKSPCPLMYHYYNTEYLGAAHGISTILQMLISVPGYLNYNSDAAKDIKDTIDYILSLQTEEGNWPCCMEELSLADHKLVHWCHGAPGVVYLMAKAYMVYKDKKYLNACVKASEVVWHKGLLYKGPGICHGVSGNGYVFLLVYRLTADDKYLYRAKRFAEFMSTEQFSRDARLPDNPQSLYEGTAGTICYLADLLVPDKAHFPFQDVFTSF